MKRLNIHTLLISLFVASQLLSTCAFATTADLSAKGATPEQSKPEMDYSEDTDEAEELVDPATIKYANDNLAFALDHRPKLRTITQVSEDRLSTKRLEFISLPHIFFNHDGYQLSEEAMEILDGAAQFVFENDSTIKRVMIQAHTSDIADQAYNYRLSDRRAYAIWDYLAGMGVPVEIMAVNSWGEDRPIDENWARNGRQRNRHVEIQLVRSTQ